MAILVPTNFEILTTLPLDSRAVVADITARDAIVAGVRFDGLTVYVTSTNDNYQLQGGILNSNWEAVGGVGGTLTIQEEGVDVLSSVSKMNFVGASVTATSTGGSPAGNDVTITIDGVGTSTLNDLTDVIISGTPADNEVLAYDSSSGNWINQTPAEYSGALLLDGSTTMTGTVVTDVGTFTSNVFGGSPAQTAFTFDTNSNYTTGTLLDVSNNNVSKFSIDYLGNAEVIGDLKFASDGAGSNWLEFNRASANSWRLDTDGVGNILQIVGNSVTVNQNVTVKRGGLDVYLALDEVALEVRGMATQTANLQEWQNNTGTVLASVDTAGNLSAVIGTFSGGIDKLTVAGSPAAAVDVSGAGAPTTGQVLTATSSTVANWQTPSPVVTDIDGLSDVTITSEALGEILKWDGSEWVNNTLNEANIPKMVVGGSPIGGSPATGEFWINNATNELSVYVNSIWEEVVYKSDLASDNGTLDVNGGYF